MKIIYRWCVFLYMCCIFIFEQPIAFNSIAFQKWDYTNGYKNN